MSRRSTRRLARVPAGSSAVRIDLHAPARESRVDGVRVVQSTRGGDVMESVMDAVEGPGISLQCDRMRKSSRSCPYGSASFVETVLMPKKKRHAMTMATQARPIASGVREPRRARTNAKTGR